MRRATERERASGGFRFSSTLDAHWRSVGRSIGSLPTE